ncbi:hypothetical protein BC834DRAFT_873347 [Gloeopeniophorella convolvens]|nr:hypothetical protein BC834DRAFT_873347 [Gloeopeniophorella convolvens]
MPLGLRVYIKNRSLYPFCILSYFPPTASTAPHCLFLDLFCGPQVTFLYLRASLVPPRLLSWLCVLYVLHVRFGVKTIKSSLGYVIILYGLHVADVMTVVHVNRRHTIISVLGYNV